MSSQNVFIFTWGYQNSKWNDAIYKTIVDKKIKNNIRRFKTRDSFLFIFHDSLALL